MTALLATPPPALEPAAAPLRVLLLEDSPLDAQLMVGALEAAGRAAQVHRVDGRAGFLEALVQGGYDLVLSDYNVPGFDGTEALSLARERLPDVPFLFVSGALGEERAIELLKRGATEYVLKDNLERLVPSIERALREAEGARQRRSAEQALRESEERYQLASLATSDAIWDFDPQLNRTQWAGALERVFGYPVPANGTDAEWWGSRVHPEDLPLVLADSQVALAAPARQRWEHAYRFRRADGSWAHVIDHGLIVRDADGKAVRVVGAIRDDSARVSAERERQRLLEEAQARVEFEQQVVGIVSHDLRNPLAAILTSASLMLRRESIDPWVARSAARIVSSADRASRMIRDLLDYTQARMGGGIPIRPEALDLHELAEQVVEEARAAFPERTLELVHSGSGHGRWDADRVAQVLTNLVTNALKYSPADTPVRVESRGEAEGMWLRVQNAGEPISPELLPRLFEPLQRGGGHVGFSDRSIGLGLYIVRELVLAHGGQVDVASTQEAGTTFTVRLPREAAGRTPPAG
ncbi:response regulator [Aggregicoccus sp. 17bor-14]|uniref:sensor histidine kinase n=1 Tax=Myxococcaceae TaxID=31 RepID=UPI00129C55B7|nr:MULTISPECIES: ATP-binding protein [Myxococcaceae]MBF5045953.1 PAS domain-containing protein [Simulacricoccus sp. 17bor-14]MRI91685.1 response regulator [Aggregicoccus sp. 17bor-14]